MGYSFNCYVLNNGNSEDLIAAKVVAQHLDLSLKIVSIKQDDVVEAVPKLVEAIGSFRAEIIIGGLATYLVSKSAHKDGLKTLFFGESADAIFGGLTKYKQVFFETKSFEAIRKLMVQDQKKLWLNTFKRLDHFCTSAGIEARAPFVDLDVVANARELPYDRIVFPNPKFQDKIELREIALNYLPEEIAKRKKIAWGRGSGLTIVVKDYVRNNGVIPNQKNVKDFVLRFESEFIYFDIWKTHYKGLAKDVKELVARDFLPQSQA